MNDIHKTQLGILKQLLFAKTLRYSDLKTDPELENNTFQFHIEKMMKEGYVEKNEKGYTLTMKGKKFANHIDTDKDKVVEVKKVSVHIYCIRGEEGKEELLCYTRLKHPFFGNQGVPSGKVGYGEKHAEAAARELKEETNLEGTPQLLKVIHYIVKDEDSKEVLDDKLFFDYFFINPSGELKGSSEGEYYWVPVTELKSVIKKPFSNVETYERAVEKILNFDGCIDFEEYEDFTKDF
ncbi:MAG: NUDIX hydrolase [Candidatus Dojkabacteria bacterium]|nr:MAG: NUDIX hydrolase [Candidatus Dojkabacteria bacterium]